MVNPIEEYLVKQREKGHEHSSVSTWKCLCDFKRLPNGLLLPILPTPSRTSKSGYGIKALCLHDSNREIEAFLLKLRKYQPIISWNEKSVLIFDKVEIGATNLYFHYWVWGPLTDCDRQDRNDNLLAFQLTANTVSVLETEYKMIISRNVDLTLPCPSTQNEEF